MIKLKKHAGAGGKARSFSFLAIVLIMTFILSKSMYGAEIETDHNPEGYVNGHAIESRFFLLANKEFGGSFKHFTALFSNVELKGYVQGNVFSLFSEIKIHPGTVIEGNIYTLSSKIIYENNGKNINIKPVMQLFHSSGAAEEGLAFFSDKIPPYVLMLAAALINSALCLIVFTAAKGFIEQGGILLSAEPLRVIRNGLISYFFMFSLILIFALTVFFLPISLLFVMIYFIILLFGQASLAMLIGLTISHRLKKKLTPFACLCTGLLITGVITNVPIISVGVNFLFMPILALGITLSGVVNALVKKKFYYLPFKTESEKKFDRDKVRKIILSSSDRKE